jgi:hypothetical protein
MCGDEIVGRPVRQEDGQPVCLTCLLEYLQTCRDSLEEARDMMIGLRSENVELKAKVAHLLSLAALTPYVTH